MQPVTRHAVALSNIVCPIWPNLDGRPSSLSPLARLNTAYKRNPPQARIPLSPSAQISRRINDFFVPCDSSSPRRIPFASGWSGRVCALAARRRSPARLFRQGQLLRGSREALLHMPAASSCCKPRLRRGAAVAGRGGTGRKTTAVNL